MYNVSQEFKESVTDPVLTYKLTGTIGTHNFTESNIVQGSFRITNQSTNTEDILLGSSYMGRLEATFTGVNIPRNNWYLKRITPTFSLKLADGTYEDLPLGVFIVKEAKHTAEGVQVVAYDRMVKFGRKFMHYRYRYCAKPYTFIQQLCNECDVTLANTEAQIEAMRNGTRKMYIMGTLKGTTDYGNDIERCWDAIFWLAQALGGFATFNRDGELEFRSYNKTVVDTISDADRLEGAKFDDYVTNYTGIYVENMVDGSDSYYGYDVAELTQQITEVTAEIVQYNSDIAGVDADIATLYQQYLDGEITEEEYRTQLAVLEAEKAEYQQLIQQDTKYLDWLEKALEKAQDGEEGTIMDLGANPFLQVQNGDSGDANTMRRAVLKSLDNISYTPFSCSTVMGLHYDLGDVIKFTGGHADNDFCCVMFYDWTLNGEFFMQGWGIDPDQALVKSKASKQARSAQISGTRSTKIMTGTTVPTTSGGGGGGGGGQSPDADGGQLYHNGDLFIKTSGGIDDEVLKYEYAYPKQDASHPASIVNFFMATTGFRFECHGYPGSSGEGGVGETYCFKLFGLQEGARYHVEFDGQFTQADGGWMSDGSLHDYIIFNGNSRFDLYSDLSIHHYATDFTYHESEPSASFPYSDLLFCAYKVQDRRNFTYAFSNIVFTPLDEGNEGVYYYSDATGNFEPISYARQVEQTATTGTQIAEVKNSDGTTTPVLMPAMTGSTSSLAGGAGAVPAPAAGDEDKFLKGDGTWAAGGGGNNLELEIDSNGEIVATYGDPTEETDPILKDETGGEIATVLNSIATELQLLGQPEVYAPVIYSNTERVVGVGENGKPLYQITVKSDSIPADTTLSTAILSNIDTFHVIACKTIQNDESRSWSPDQISMYTYTGSGTYYGAIQYIASDHALYFRNSSRVNAIKVEAVIQYTKTTDVAGSGLYAALGVPAVHYSTTEQVIGTWLGKPLYSRVFDLGSDVIINYTGFTDTTIDATNMETIVDCFGIYSTGVTRYNVMANKNNNIIRLQADRNNTTIGVRYVVMQYTKTS